MVRYRNVGGDSGVYAYEIGNDSIQVQFSDGAIYLYNNSSAGGFNIEQMKMLATNGSGLNSFINTTVRKKYASKIR